MFRKLDDFFKAYEQLSNGSSRMLEALTDEALAQPVAEGHRTLGQVAWHIVATIPEMMNRTGLGLSSVDPHAPPPTSAKEIVAAWAVLGGTGRSRGAPQGADDRSPAPGRAGGSRRLRSGQGGVGADGHGTPTALASNTRAVERRNRPARSQAVKRECPQP